MIYYCCEMQCISLRLEETKLNRLPRYAYQLEFWIFLSVGSPFLLTAASSFHNTLLFLAKAKNVQGTVIEVGYAPTVAFWEETRVTVFYDPENPENAKIGDFGNFFALPTAFFLIGTLCFLCGFLSSKDKT